LLGWSLWDSSSAKAAGPLLTRFHLDDPSSYLAAAAVALLPVPFLFLLRPDSVEARKRVDQVERPAEAA